MKTSTGQQTFTGLVNSDYVTVDMLIEFYFDENSIMLTSLECQSTKLMKHDIIGNIRAFVFIYLTVILISAYLH